MTSMKLQKHISRKIGNKEYLKYVIVIPKEDVDTLGWKDKQELSLTISGNKATIKPKK